MMYRSWYLGCLVFGSLMLVVHHASSQDSIPNIGFSSGPLSTCYYRGVTYLHSEVWKIDECTNCTCTHTTTTCWIESCQPVFCVEPLKLPGDCCFSCPYDVTVREVTPKIKSQRNVTTNADTTLVMLVLEVEVTFRDARSTTGVSGESLWELSAWIAPVNTSHGFTIGYTEQILNVDQASQRYIKGDQFIFRDVLYPFVAPSLNCDEASVCVELKRGRNAVTTDDLPFNINSDPHSLISLIGCTSLCTDAIPKISFSSGPISTCYYRGVTYLHSEVWDVDVCTTCTCTNSTIDCVFESCQPVFCVEPLKLPGDCCFSCPYEESSYSVPISSDSNGPLLPCIYYGVPYLHSEVWDKGDCTTCTCTNGTTTCVLESCQPVFCVEPLKLPGECCFSCPYGPPQKPPDLIPLVTSSVSHQLEKVAYVTVRKVKPTIQSKGNETTNGDATLVLEVKVKFRDTRKTTGVSGESLWELSAWIAPVNPFHSHTRIGYTEQVLNVDQASQWYIKGDQFIFRDVVYPFVAPSLNCDEANVCVELKRGRNAVTIDDLPFIFSSDPDSSTPLIGCTSLCTSRKEAKLWRPGEKGRLVGKGGTCTRLIRLG